MIFRFCSVVEIYCFVFFCHWILLLTSIYVNFVRIEIQNSFKRRFQNVMTNFLTSTHWINHVNFLKNIISTDEKSFFMISDFASGLCIIGKQISDWIYFNVVEHLNYVHLLHLKYAGRRYCMKKKYTSLSSMPVAEYAMWENTVTTY